MRKNIAEQQIFISPIDSSIAALTNSVMGSMWNMAYAYLSGYTYLFYFVFCFFFLKGGSSWNKNWKSKLGVEHFLGESFYVGAQFKASPMSP